jgi:hypothetical protein
MPLQAYLIIWLVLEINSTPLIISADPIYDFLAFASFLTVIRVTSYVFAIVSFFVM